MSYKYTQARAILASLVAVSAPFLKAQTATSATPDAQKDETIVLSPFVIDASEDANGYAANSTLAGTRIRTDLKDVASSITVVTKQFLQDTSSHNAQDLLVYTPNTEVGGIRGNYSGQGASTVYNEPLINPSSNNRVRGLDSADNTRDFFLTDIPFDTFNTDRIDLQRGPNSILFGVGSPAGIINASINGAAFKDSYKVENVTGKYGSERNSIDFNKVLISDMLAIRVAAVNDDEKYQEKPAFNDATRYYGAIRFDPKLFTDSIHTTIQANFEYGRVNSNNPRTTPPDDQISLWFHGVDGIASLNKAVVAQDTPGQGAGSAIGKADFPNFAEGRTYWSTPILYYNGSNPTTPGVSPATLSGIPTNAVVGEIGTGWAIDSAGNMVAKPVQPGGTVNGIGGLPNVQPVAIAPFAHYAGQQLVGGSFYADKVLTDPTIFDFFDKLLDGNNKREWQNWHAGDVSLAQTFFNDRVGYQVVYDKQRYTAGQTQFLSGENYGINIDANETLPNSIPGSPSTSVLNPNVGRPFVAAGGDAGNQSSTILRDSTRATAFGEFRASDWWHQSTIAKIIGTHRLTGLLALDHKKQTDMSWSSYALDPSYETDNNFDTSVKITNYRLFNWVDYIGPTLAGASSPSGADLSNVNVQIAPPKNTSVTWFNSHWAHSLNPNDPGYVDPNAPYTYLNADTAAVTNSTQSNNPANYVGWQKLPVTYLDSKNPADFPALVTGGERTRFRDSSKALVWQGFMLDGDLVGTSGWSKDSIVNYDSAAHIDSTTSIAAINYDDNENSRTATEGETRTWGIVYHIPKSLTKYLPYDSGFSVFYNRSHNFKADAPRQNLFGQQIPNPDGITKEYGAQFTTLSDKISLKATHYETTVHYATLTSDLLGSLGGLSYYADLIPAWGYGYAAQVQAGLDGKYGNATADKNQWNYVVTDARRANANADLSVIGTPAAAATMPVATYGYQGTGPVTMTDIVNAWINLPVPDSFFDYYGITGNRPEPAVTHSTGKLYEGFSSPFADGDVPGVGGQQPSISHVPVSTVDTISKGWEFELAGQPTKNWNVSVNYSRTDATKTNIDAVTQKFMADNLKFYQGPGGQLRLWGAGNTAGSAAVETINPTGPETYSYVYGTDNGNTVGPKWIQGVYNPYQVIASAAGQSAPEVAPWRLNLVTTYTMDRTAVKGLFFGGGLRIEAGKILGYRLDKTTGILNVDEPEIGPNDSHVDLWLGYSRKLGVGSGHAINWRIALNLRNVGDSTKLVDAKYEPDGTLALARIQEGTSWQLTNTFEF